jgi:chromosome segregation ATPase
VADILQQIKELETSLKSARQLLKICSGEIEKLKNDKTASQQVLSDKEKELKELRSKLFICNSSKEEIQQALNNKVIELENSNLSNEDKKDQIIKLLTKNGFSNICKELVEA